MKRPVLLLLSVCAAFGLAFAVTASGGVVKASAVQAAGSPAAKDRFKGKEPIIIGMPVALTGFINFYDAPSLASARIKVDEINASGGLLGRPVKIVTADTKTDLSLIRGAALEVVNKGAQFLIPTLDYDFGSPSARVGEEHKPPLISISLAGDPRFGAKGIGPHTFNQFPAGGTESAIAATFAFTVKGWRHPYILRDPSISYSKTFTNFFEFAWSNLAGKSSIAGEDTFMNSDPSIATQIARLKAVANKVDFIFMGSYAPGGASATKQIRAAGIDLPIISGAGFDGTFWLNAVPNVKNFFVVAGGVTTPGADPNPLRRAVYQKYFQKYGHQAPLGEQTLNGYSAVEAYAIAIKRAGSTDPDKVLAELNKFHNQPLAIGSITWTPTCHITFGRTLPIVTFVNGKEMFVAEPKPDPKAIPPSIC